MQRDQEEPRSWCVEDPGARALLCLPLAPFLHWAGAWIQRLRWAVAHKEMETVSHLKSHLHFPVLLFEKEGEETKRYEVGTSPLSGLRQVTQGVGSLLQSTSYREKADSV